jgi:kinetochore protein Nuf2
MTIQKSHIFPNLPISDILPCLRDLQIPCTDEDLKKPTPVRVLAMYEQLTELLVSIPRDDSAFPSFAAMEILEHPNLHNDSMAMMGFYRHL